MESSVTSVITLTVVVSVLSVALFGLGLIVGYWRGMIRARQQHTAAHAQLEKLAAFGRTILGAQLKLDALCEIVYQQAAKIVDTDDFQLGLFEGNDYHIKVWVRDGERRPERRFVGAAKTGLVGWVHQTAQSLRVNDFQQEWDKLPAKPVYVDPHPPRSAIFVPLITAGEVIGVISVYGNAPNVFSEESVRLLSVLASQTSAALRNAQQYEETRRRAEQVRLIAEVTRQITAVQPLPDLFRQIVTLVHDMFHYYGVNILTYDETTSEIKLRASSAIGVDPRHLTLKAGEGLIGWAYQHAQTVNVPDVSTDSRYLPVPALEQTRSEICLPLHVERRVLGILDVQSDQVSAFGDDDVTMLESLAGQLAIALQEAETYDMQRRQAERINAMAEASRAVVSILDINALLDQVVDLVADYFGYDRVHLFLRSGDQVVFRSGSGVHSAKWSIQNLSYPLNSKGIIPWAARTGETVICGDVQNDDRYVPGPGIEDSRSEMTVPIRMGQRVLGIFDIQSTHLNHFDSEDARLVQALSDTVAIGLRNAGLFATETRRRMLAETLRDISTVLASSLDLPSVLDGILLGLERVVNYEAALILLLEEGTNAYSVSAVRGTAGEDDVIGDTLPVDEAINDRIKSLLTRLEALDVPVDEVQHDYLTVPLTVGGRDIGVLAIDRIGPDHFSPEDVEIITTFGNQAAVAITNAQLYTGQKEEAWISNALLQVAEATSRSTSLDDVLGTVARITPLLVGVAWCIVLLSEKDGFRVVEIEGTPDALRQLKGHFFTDSDWEPLVRLRTEGKPLILNADTPLPRGVPESVIRRDGQAMMLPLYAKGEIMGAMLVAQRGDAESITQRKLALVSGIANQAALAIESAQLFAAQQEEAWVTTALLSVAESLNSTIGRHQTLNAIVRLVPMLVGVARCGIMEWDDSTQKFIGRAAWGLSTESEKAFRELWLSPAGSHFVATLALSSDPLASDRDPVNALPAELAQVFETSGLVGFPIIAQGKLTGVMLVDRVQPGELFDQRRVNILTGTAQQVAMALEAARLQEEATENQRLERELEVAQGIQHSFLPQQLPLLPGWGLAAFYRTARQVGGDFYDFIPLRDNKWGIVIADVADKGVPAALFMALSRTLIRAVAFSRENPAETLMRVNDLLLSDSRSDLFVTVWYGVWTPETGEIVYASAGHNPPLLVSPDGLAEELSAKGIALGAFESIKIESKRVQIRPGHVLIAYTDGVTEATRLDSTEFGLTGLQSVAATSRHCNANEIVDRVVQSIDHFVGEAAQFDDLTLVVLKCEMAVTADEAECEALMVDVDGR